MPLLLFAVLFALLLAGFPVAFTLGGVAVLASFFLADVDFGFLPMRIFGIMSNQLLMAVPLFVYMGVMLEKSGLAEELLETMAMFFGRMRGGLAISVVVVGALLAASTGIVGATVVTMGILSLPTMLKRKYSPEVATGTICAAGTLGQLIPPSIVLILLGTQLDRPVGDLFMASVIPGLALVALYLIWLLTVALFRPTAAPAMPPDEVKAFLDAPNLLRRIVLAFVAPLLLIVTVLGSIFAGIASPTEAAAVGAFGATLLTLLRRQLTYANVKSVMAETTHLSCMVFMILVGATAFSLVFREMHGDRFITELIERANLGPTGFLLIVLLVVFIAGFFIDFIEIIFIIIPVVRPIFEQLDVPLLWVGVLVAMNLQTSFLTPPFGFSLFYLKGVAPPEVKTTQIYRGVIPFIIIQLIGLGLVFSFPDLALWLPQAVNAWRQ